MSYREHNVLVIGAAGLDMKVQPREAEIVPARSNPARIRWGWGGVARNIAENLARLGAEVHLMTAVGDDQWGHLLLRRIKELDINTEAVVVSPDHPTASYVALYEQHKQLWLAFDDMAVMDDLTPGHVNRLRRLFKEADMICLDSNIPTRTLKTVFRLAEKYDVPVCADPTASLLSHRFVPYLDQLTLVTPDKDEAEALVGQLLEDEESISVAARQLVQAGVELAIITLGAEGLYYATLEESGRVPATPVEVVDPTGVGDALTAAVAYGLLEGVSPEEAVRLGMAAAAQTLLCQHTVCPSLTLETLYERLVL